MYLVWIVTCGAIGAKARGCLLILRYILRSPHANTAPSPHTTSTTMRIRKPPSSGYLNMQANCCSLVCHLADPTFAYALNSELVSADIPSGLLSPAISSSLFLSVLIFIIPFCSDTSCTYHPSFTTFFSIQTSTSPKLTN